MFTVWAPRILCPLWCDKFGDRRFCCNTPEFEISFSSWTSSVWYCSVSWCCEKLVRYLAKFCPQCPLFHSRRVWALWSCKVHKVLTAKKVSHPWKLRGRSKLNRPVVTSCLYQYPHGAFLPVPRIKFPWREGLFWSDAINGHIVTGIKTWC